MKKSTYFVLSFFAFLFIVSSCKKDYSCKCTGTALGVSADTTIYLGNMKKKEAKDKCASFQNTYGAIAMLFGVTIDCEVE